MKYASFFVEKFDFHKNGNFLIDRLAVWYSSIFYIAIKQALNGVLVTTCGDRLSGFGRRSCKPVDTAAVKWKTLVTDAASQGAMSADQFKGLLKLSESSRLALVKKSRIHDAYDVEHSPFARGKFAAVRRSTHRVSGVAFAAKFVRRRRRASEVLHEILHEVAILELARAAAGQPGSERIVRLHEVFETPTETAMVLEMVPGGELQRLIDAGETISEPEVRRMLRQVLEAVSFLHDRNIAHLDLKPQNILLTGPFPGCDVKLCDFGISRLIEPGVEVREVLGTPDYVAPEVLQYEPISLRTDMWSVGVLAYVLLSGHSPFGGDTKQETFCNISQGQLDFPEELFGDVSQPALDFISALLIVEASERLSSRASMQHPWLSPPSGTLPDADVQQVIIKRSSCEKDINGFSNKVLVLDKKMMC